MACANSVAVATGLALLSLGVGGITARAHADDGRACLKVRNDVPAGAVLTTANADPVECDIAQVAAKLRFDRSSRSVLAAEPIAAGGYLGRVALPSGDVVQRGERLSLRSRSGPVVIERSVVAMQVGRSGRRVFVRDADGHVFAVRAHTDRGNAR